MGNFFGVGHWMSPATTCPLNCHCKVVGKPESPGFFQ